MSERWAEFHSQADGVGVTLYEQNEDGEPVVVDETWFTDAELEENFSVTLDDD